MSKSKIFDQETNNVIEWLLIAIVGAVSFVVAVVVVHVPVGVGISQNAFCTVQCTTGAD